MQTFQYLLSRVRRWRLWDVLRRSPVNAATGLPPSFPEARSFRRGAARHRVRVYSLCGSCGASLSASATLCDACARSRSLPNS